MAKMSGALDDFAILLIFGMIFGMILWLLCW